MADSRRSMLKNALLLGAFAVLCVGLVAVIHQFTQARIEQAQREARGRLLLELLPPGSYDNHPLDAPVEVFEPKLLGKPQPAQAFVARLRGEAKFDSIDALVAQIARDCDDARAVLGVG